MTHTLTIAGRELRERSRILMMAAAMAVLPFLVALIPAARENRPEIISMMAGFLAVALSAGVAIALGASTIAGDLASKRLSFYFSKPISPAALWFGKAIAALITSFVCFAIIAVPSMLAAGSRWTGTWGPHSLLAYLALGLFVIFLLSHVLSTMVRSHSARIGIDFVLVAATVVAILWILKPLVFGAGLDIAKNLLTGIGVAILAIVFVAPVWQLAQGRTEIRRSHAALQRALWIPIAAVLLIAAGYATWLVSFGPNDLAAIFDVEQAPGGDAVIVSGTGNGRGDYTLSFIVDTNSGRYARVDVPRWWGARFSQDGKVTAWLQPVSVLKPMERMELHTRRLDDPKARTIATGIYTDLRFPFAISNDGTRVAVMDGPVLTIHELATQRILASATFPNSVYGREMYFANPDVVRVVDWYAGPRIEISELSARTRKAEKTGNLTMPASPSWWVVFRASADGSRVLFPKNGILADARTGATIATLPINRKNPFATAILRDGRVAIANESRLHIFAPDGTPEREIALPFKRAWISGEVGGKVILLGMDNLQTTDRTGRGRRMVVIDAVRGTIERTMNDIKGPAPGWHEPRLNQFPAGKSLTAVNAEGKLVLWDPLTGQVKPFPRS